MHLIFCYSLGNILAARLYISAENSFITPCGTRQLSVAQLLLELCIQKVFCCLPKIIVSPISKSTSSFVDKTIEGIAFHLLYVFFHDAFGRRYNENDIRTICNSFVALSWYIRLSSKPVIKIAASFGRKRWTAAFSLSLSEEPLKFFLAGFYKKRPLQY